MQNNKLMKIDFHVHTKESFDSISHIKDIINTAEVKGLDAIAVVDHNRFTDYSYLERGKVEIIQGVEYSTDQGHMLVYFLDHCLSEDGVYISQEGRFDSSELIDAAHTNGAMVFIAHPFKPFRAFTDATLNRLDGVEVFNSRAAFSSKRKANSMAVELVKANNKPFVAGSDSHWIKEIGNSYWEGQVINGDIKSALLKKEGRVYAKYSPIHFEARSQIVKSFKCREYFKVFKPIIKLIYGTTFEIAIKTRLIKIQEDGIYFTVY